MIAAADNPFADAVEEYNARGWLGTIPLPYRRKSNPPAGFTGHDGRVPTAADIARWANDPTPHNVALRLPGDIIGIDVDDGYGDKVGAGQLADVEAEHGTLPATWCSTSRGDDNGPGLSRILYFRVPNGTRMRGSIAGSIEVIQRHHRFAVAPPSIRPEGGRYRWYDPAGEPSDTPPHADEIPALPWAWIEAFRSVGNSTTARPAAPEEVTQFLAEHVEAAHPNYLAGVESKLAEWQPGQARHPFAVEMMPWAMREAAAGLYPAADAVEVLWQWWTKVMADEPARRDGPEFTDIVAWAVAIVGTDPDRISKIRTGADARAAAGTDWIDDVADGGPAKSRKRGPDSRATELVRLACQHYRFSQDETGRAFAVALEGPAIAKPLEGGRGALREELARRYYEEHDRAASKSALADAIATLAGMAATADPTPLALRSAVLDDRVVIDLGRPDGHAVVVTADGWSIVEQSPVIFRRTELTGQLPNPVTGDGAAALRRIINVANDTVPLVVGYLVSTFLTDVPRPILAVFAEQGAGKSTTVRALVNIVDPSPVPLRAAPTNLEGWIVAAAGSSVVAVDNVSTIPEWLSDALCRAATGEGLVRRALYTNDALAVTTMRRSVMLTTIDAGSLRGDLAERLVALELERIDTADRMTEADIAERLNRDLPAIFAAVLDALAAVLRHRPQLPFDLELPRMADFGRILAALDAWAGTDSLAAYNSQLGRVAVDVVDGDPFASAIRTVAEAGGFDGTATELLQRITPYRPERGWWPTSPRMLSAAVRRAAPALRTVGVGIDTGRTRDHRRITVALLGDGVTVVTVPPLLNAEVRKGGGDANGHKPPDPRGCTPSQPSQPSPANTAEAHDTAADEWNPAPWTIEHGAELHQKVRNPPHSPIHKEEGISGEAPDGSTP